MSNRLGWSWFALAAAVYLALATRYVRLNRDAYYLNRWTGAAAVVGRDFAEFGSDNR